MTDSDKAWETYEEVAVYLLDQVGDRLGLDFERVEGKQHVYGSRSGAKWEIDGKAVKVSDEGFVIIECRRYTTSRLKQEHAAGLAYRITDTGADGGILVSPLGFQEGAKKIADAEGIQEVFMDENSTRSDYMAKFLDRATGGVSAQIRFNVEAEAEATPADNTGESAR